MSVSVLVLVWFVHGSLVSKRVRWPKTKTATPKKSVLNRNETQVQLKEAVNIESVAVAINAKTFQKVKSNTADAQTPWWGADDLHQVLKWWWYIIPVHDICDWTPGGQQGSVQAVLKVTSSQDHHVGADVENWCDIDKYLIILQSLLMRSESSARFEGIYEESRAVFLCNEGEGHTGAEQRIPIMLRDVPLYRLCI